MYITYCVINFKYLGFQSFDFERTRWRLFQKRVVRAKFDIYVLLQLNFKLLSYNTIIKRKMTKWQWLTQYYTEN
jgi:hypothetical protein